MRRNTLNGIVMGNKRRDQVYQTVMTDLALAGVMPRDVAEKLLGYEIPSYLKLDDGTHFEPKEKTADKKEKTVKKEDKPKADAKAEKKDPLADGLGL